MDSIDAPTLDRLAQDHDRVRATLVRLEAFLEPDAMPLDPDFSRLRWQLARELAAHLAAERHAYPAVRARLRGDAAYRGIDHALGEDLARHAAAWTIARIEREWLAYRREGRLLLRRLRHRMTYEERTIFPLLTQA